MTVRITNYCDMMCLHCMEESTVNGKHMDFDTFKNVISLAKDIPNLKTFNISGGEPTSHPELLPFLKYVLKELPGVTITLLSNGSFVHDKKLSNDILILLKKHKHLLLQITTVKGLYPKHGSNISAIHTFCKKDKKSIALTTDIGDTLVAVGRAKKNIDKLSSKYRFDGNNASKCFNLYNTLQYKSGLVDVIVRYKDSNVSSYCSPLIKENGDVVFGEFEACSTICNINDDDYRVLDTYTIDGPCGSCITKQESYDIIKLYITEYKTMFNKYNAKG